MENHHKSSILDRSESAITSNPNHQHFLRRKSMKMKMFILFIVIITGHAIADIIYFDDGGSHPIGNSLYQNDRIFLDRNIANTPGTSLQLFDEGIILDIWAFNSSTVDVSGGTIGIYSTSTSFFGLGARGDSEITVSGGTLYGDLVAYDNGKIYLYGSDFSVGGVDLSNGESLRGFGISEEYVGTSALTGTITGTLLDGTSLNTIFRISEDDINADIIIVPEPMTISLFGLGALAIFKQRK